MGEVQKYDIDQTDGDFAYMAPCPDGEWVQVESYQALEAENAKLRAELERRVVPDGWKLVPVEPTPEMQQAALEHSRANVSLGGPRTLTNGCELWASAEVYKTMLAAAPSAPKADPVKVQLLEALEKIVATPFNWREKSARTMGEIALAAIAAARTGEGE